MVKNGTCGLCQGGCAVVYTIENGKIVKAEPDKESPKGRLCPRGALVPDILYGEERIKRPLIRVGERGEGKFRAKNQSYFFTIDFLIDFEYSIIF